MKRRFLRRVLEKGGGVSVYLVVVVGFVNTEVQFSAFLGVICFTKLVFLMILSDCWVVYSYTLREWFDYVTGEGGGLC